MYEVCVSRTFVAQHFLTVPNPGPEGELHSHRYGVELRLRGESLNEFGYLVDIDDVRAALDETVARYRDETLNDLPELEGQNPSVERFAREFAARVSAAFDAPEVTELTVRLHEGDDAWAAFERSM
ncbi:6-pyruvoyl tetrahydropterin synthase [Haladaptatus sp. W1]|uniref:6-pyruvoyl trahydropterin synthase family protein n=1 Tax=Haladaptatus sp. W1 TaxID=1897478 RepID=UPI0008498358|nr:6-carboxytetrahydropterin synthase [Haladaptatus sp. W1]ODR79308.1 6-pyruvoyl tetrahydropterin synthase [Haladaptatus sp. W1]